MNPKILNIIAIGSCFLFLFGNIIFALTDNPTGTANPKIYYIPDAIKNFALIWLCWEYAKKFKGVIYLLWVFFLWLSAGQLVNFMLFNPYYEMISDRVFLVVAVIDFIIRYKKLRSNANRQQ